MEQRSDTNIQPVQAAGIDPAYVPGLVNLRAPEAADKARKDVPRQKAADDEPAGTDAAAEAAGDTDGGEGPVVSEEPEEPQQPQQPEESERSDKDDGDAEPSAEDEGAGGDGPSLDVSDRRGSITADRSGVRFTLDGEEAEFRWDEVGAVEIATPRFGKRFGVTVHTAGRRWYDADVEAPSRADLKEWTATLDRVLDAYLEEG